MSQNTPQVSSDPDLTILDPGAVTPEKEATAASPLDQLVREGLNGCYKQLWKQNSMPSWSSIKIGVMSRGDVAKSP